MKYFTADSHFSLYDYHGAIARDFRPFKSCKQMNRKIIRIWNKQAKRGDTIYHLGDFSNFNKTDESSYKITMKYVKKLKAKVVLVLGNNENRILEREFNGDYEAFKNFLLSCGFADVVKEGMYIEIDDKKFYLNHFPKNYKKDAINLFGHIHGTGFVKRYGFNVGLDNRYLRMFSENDIIEMVSRIPYFDENVYE